MAVLQARGVHRFFRRGDDEVAALRDVTFDVNAGELIAVRGPSGSGKSTLLAVLAGIDSPDAGEVRFDGALINSRGSPDCVAVRRQHIGVLTQSGGLLEHLSVRDNVRLVARVRGSKEQVDAALAAVDLSGRAGAWPSELSGGETARAGLAVAMVGSPRLLLADEPTAEVSSAEEASLLRLLSSARPDAGATVVVTHSLVVADTADRVLELAEGRLL